MSEKEERQHPANDRALHVAPSQSESAGEPWGDQRRRCLSELRPPELERLPHPYVRLARMTVERLLSGQRLPLSGVEAEGDESLWNQERACFVSIKTLRGDLRGCIGTILPTRPGLDLEIVSNAVAASTRDPRFRPMTAPELERVSFSVDVLGSPEPISDRGALDPAAWGVIVTQGTRRGVLLPDLDGVETVGQQLSIAAQKAGIRNPDSADVKIERFRVDRYKEERA